MGLEFQNLGKPTEIESETWFNWSWQMRSGLKTHADFTKYFDLNEDEAKYFSQDKSLFKTQVTPYYAYLAKSAPAIRRILIPTVAEFNSGLQQMKDPLGEEAHSPAKRIVHRYPDRALFLVTDVCSVYCRFCTRKYFTGKEQSFVKSDEYNSALNYLKSNTQIKEVILSGGDPLTLSNNLLFKTLKDIRNISHIEIIRIGTRMPVVCPMRVDRELALGLREYGPVFIMSHFNHPKELTHEAANALGLFVDNGIPVFNQMVLLNGVNNHASIVRALSRRLLYLRVKPYYMFQCDPSLGTDHLRTSIEQSMAIQRELWGSLSGLAMPNLSLDIPGGGGKIGLVPNFITEKNDAGAKFTGWDGKPGEYINPTPDKLITPPDITDYPQM